MKTIIMVPGNPEIYEVQAISLDPANTFWQALNLTTGKLKKLDPFEVVETIG